MPLPSDPAFAPYAQLHGAKTLTHPEAGPCFVCEGRFLVEEALKDADHLRILSVLASERAAAGFAGRVPTGIPLLSLRDAELESLVGFPFHRGVLACVAIPPEPPLEILRAARHLLVLPRLDNVDNLGNLLRTGAALGIDGVLAGSGPSPFDRRSVRVSMGAAWRVPVWQRPDDAELVALLADWRSFTGGEVAAAALRDDAVALTDWRPAGASALVLGPEGPGLDPAWLDRCDRVVCIPMARGMDSLNVAAAGAILMARQLGLS